MYRHLEHRLTERVRECLGRRYPGVTLPSVVIEQPPKVELGDFAIPVFPFAKPLRSAPLKIAEAIRAELGPIEGIAEIKVSPPGYLNVKAERSYMAASLAKDEKPPSVIPPGKILVEHSSINPNKAAHIGHLRNAILGDTFVRLLRNAGREVDIQNYIDNTGVQVADVVVGFIHLEKKSRAEIEALTRQPRFDYYCWDLYARVSQWYEQDKQNRETRLATLHAIEDVASDAATVADLISTAVLHRHLETMDRLDIEYDFLPRESEILQLHFWDAAFTKLKDAGVLTFESEGKNKGCWVMRRAGTENRAGGDVEGAEEGRISEEDQKVIVRSNGTVGYVGKDIAYHMWKFGLLGRDFGYLRFYRYPNHHECWISTTDGEKVHPHFGDVAEIYNVIDARQSEAQNTVIEALRGLGHDEAADHYTHFSYEMVALTPRCAAELGYTLSEEDKTRSYIEVSGRKGFGVKADDLLDQLIASAKKEVDSRHPAIADSERLQIATQIAIGALRYFMLKYTKPSVIAFDFKDALSFEGETGPYAQYAVVRATSIFRKAGIDPETFGSNIAGNISPADLGRFLTEAQADEIWELWLAASKTSYVVDQCIATTEPAYLAKHVFQLAQLFNTFYHRHPILSEPDEGRKQFLLITVAVVRRELIRALKVMGITVPPVM
ncbi:Arginyl-tRNA synthetase [Candidatus Sulfotelmatobacter kueseliae]|uniref:arginine--tRNA ligase n=1 Tax=Candidatus Sulfotelmatobacter kueseliae TaxID=2042962 RepID=A0A2U3KIK2_9BACT|nr:Arginyl-tRNA synthetase [Candidatus Sulfotelmatobacter kueseliae]